MGNLIGPDVSHHQGVVDWSRVSGSCVFAFCKATEGVTFRDKRMAANRQGMRDANLILKGLYHFARPGNNTAVAEADHFCDVVGALEPGEVAVLDLETAHLSRQATGQWTRDWMKGRASVWAQRPGSTASDRFSTPWTPVGSSSTRFGSPSTD